jgi:allantoicase
VQLGARGAPAIVEVDTAHFKGNYPDRCSLEAIDAPDGARITDLIKSARFTPILSETKLGADARAFFDVDTPDGGAGPATHVRLNIFPDGGVSRLRIWGRRS